jgi:hypothetical protein
MPFGTLRSHIGFSALSAAILLLLTACAKKQGVPQVAAPMPVTVATVEQRDVSLFGDWVATLDGFVNAQIQPQVSGYMIKQDYREGSVVQSGQVLFEIDPRPFQATLDQAEGPLALAIHIQPLGTSAIVVVGITGMRTGRDVTCKRAPNRVPEWTSALSSLPKTVICVYILRTRVTQWISAAACRSSALASPTGRNSIAIHPR